MKYTLDYVNNEIHRQCLNASIRIILKYEVMEMEVMRNKFNLFVIKLYVSWNFEIDHLAHANHKSR